MMTYISRHWLDSLVHIQSSQSAGVCARTLDTLRRYSLTEVVKERQTKHTGVTIHYALSTCMYVQSMSMSYTCTISVICNFVGAHVAINWGAQGASILFTEIGFCMASCSYTCIYDVPDH